VRTLTAVGIIFTEISIRNVRYLCLKFKFGSTSVDELVHF